MLRWPNKPLPDKLRSDLAVLILLAPIDGRSAALLESPTLQPAGATAADGHVWFF